MNSIFPQGDGCAPRRAVSIVSLWNRYGDLLWEPGKHKETNRAYVYEIQAIADRYGIEHFDNSLIDALRAACRKRGNKNSTINRKLACLGKLLRKHHRDGHLDRLPDLSKYPERNGRIRFLSSQEERALFDCLDFFDPHHGNLARFLVNTGARVGEALGLKWSDVDAHNATFWETKANTPRTVPLTRAAIAVLVAERGKRPIGPFADIRYPNFRANWLKAKKRAGLQQDPQIVPHILRHTCASRLAQNGVDIKRIQEFLGHRTLAMTMRYAHLAPKHLQVCAQTLDEINEQHLAEDNGKAKGRYTAAATEAAP
ncbi:tyrosine-type recombinase/integrase [Salaquimonas pukyongi]|uniref:tyrosine-type recombinase/integrase n=1 Tax=Salaquimonas pukyongi TaxID=2712698 RepID=UPI00096B9557|nr:site-specific integrase [Salaquimonas pukyongi]